MELKVNDEKKPKILLEFLEYLQVIKNYSQKTIESYSLDLMLFFTFYQHYQKLKLGVEDFDIFVLSKVKTSDIISFIVYIGFNKDSSPYTRERRIVAIRRFYKWLQYLKPKIIKVNPAETIGNIVKIERLPKYLSLEKAKQMQEIFTKQNSRYPQRNNAIISLFLSSGIRLRELINIDIEDINFNNNSIKIKGKGAKERKVYFNEKCKKKIQKYLEVRKTNESKALFTNKQGKRIGVDGIEGICQKAYELIGVGNYQYTTHTLRHTAATIIYKYVTQDLLILREFLGHSSIKATEIYTHIYNEDLKMAVEKNPLNCLEKKIA